MYVNKFLIAVKMINLLNLIIGNNSRNNQKMTLRNNKIKTFLLTIVH